MVVRTNNTASGFTMLEILIVISILVIVTAIGVPQYFASLRQARIDKARTEVMTITAAIEAYADRYGRLPMTLYQVGYGGRLDPWGVPYCYLNYKDGTGDGLYWAVDAGLVDPNAFVQQEAAPVAAAPAAPPSEPAAEPATGLLGGALGRVLGRPVGGAALGEVVATADELVANVVAALGREATPAEVDRLHSVAIEFPNIQVFTAVPVSTVRRRDRYMLPLNSDYDLFSLGPNRSTAVAIGQDLAQDDVIRANDGGYFGLASNY